MVNATTTGNEFCGKSPWTVIHWYLHAHDKHVTTTTNETQEKLKSLWSGVESCHQPTCKNC